MRNKNLIGLCLFLWSFQSSAAQIIASCTMQEDLVVSGKNVDQRLPLASVSKIYTSLLGTMTFDLSGSFSTLVYATEVTPGSQQYDVHLQGSRDPYFNKFKMHMIISRLNEAGIKKIRYLTFDEKIKYLHETDRSFYIGKKLVNPLLLKEDMEFPQPGYVAAELSQPKIILKSYAESQKILSQEKLNMYKNPVFSPAKVLFKPSKDFTPTADAKKIVISSQDVARILKSLNWNSNNHAANQLFMAAGGLEKFSKTFYEDFKQTENDVRFVNGSGQNHDLTGNSRLYNEATCRNAVRTIRIFRKAVEAQKLQLQDVMSVVGVDVGSTVGGATYSNAYTRGAVVAKTGTIGTNVTLIGVAFTQNGPKYFFYNAGLKVKASKRWMAQEEIRARSLISAELQKLIKNNGGPVALKYESNNPLLDSLDNYDESDASEAEGLLAHQEPDELPQTAGHSK